MSRDFEDLLQRALDDRAAGVRTAPDQGDLRRRIHHAQRVSARRQRRALVAALVVVAGSVGGVVGAITTRPAGVTADQADSPVTTTQLPPPVTTVPGNQASVGGGPGQTGVVTSTSTQHRAAFGGVTVEWLLSRLAKPIEVVAGSGEPATCSKADVVSLTIDAGTPVAGGSGVVGMPAVGPQGLAVVSSGTFGSSGAGSASAGGASGWWAIVEAGSDASEVAVQFPSGSVERAPVVGGAAVLASVAPAGESASSLSQYASAVAEGGSRALGSLEFLVGGGLAVVDAAAAPSGAAALADCPISSSIAAGNASLGQVSGPPAPLVAAGDVVAAYSQAYDIDPLLGLTWNFSAVDLGSSLGCPVETLPTNSAGGGADGLSSPAVVVEAITFTSPVSAIVAYQRGSGLLETGTAQLVDGSWKVGRASYCADLQSSSS